MCYGNSTIRATYAEIKDVEEEHVNMYESLIDPTESLYEKLLLHEFTEVCNYYTCYEDETCDMMKPIWEEFLGMEIEHLHKAAELFKKHENRSPEEVIGEKIVIPNRFKSQKDYVKAVLKKEVNKRLNKDKGYIDIDELPKDWASYAIQKAMSKEGSPTERTISTIAVQKERDITIADEELLKELPKILEKGLQTEALAPDTVSVDEYTAMNKKEFEY